MNKWPTQSQINEALGEMEGTLASKPLSSRATSVDKFKHALCAHFVLFLNSHKISQQQLADLLGVDKSIASKIIHYHLEDFTIDRLVKYLSVLDPELKIEIKAKVV